MVVQLPISNIEKSMYKKSLPGIMRLVIGRTKYCYMSITSLITKPNVAIFFVMVFHPVRSITTSIPLPWGTKLLTSL